MKKKCSPRKLRRKNPVKRRKNPAVTCPGCGAGNKDGRDTCWKCHFELKTTERPHFGRALRARAPKKRQKRRHLKRQMKRHKKRNKR